MDDVMIPDVVGSPSLKNEKDGKVDYCVIPQRKLKEERTIKVETENELEDLGGVSVNKTEPNATYEQLNFLEGDPPNLEFFPEKEEPVDLKYEVKNFQIVYVPSNQEDPLNMCTKVERDIQVAYEDDPLKLCTKVKIKLEDFEENLEENLYGEDYNDDFVCVNCRVPCRLKNSAQKEIMNLFCVECYVTLRKKAYDDWITKVHSELKSCSTCLIAFVNCLNIEKHDCTCDNVFYCSECHIIMNRKEDMIFHVKQCYKVKEQIFMQSENYLDVNYVNAIQRYSRVRNNLLPNEDTSKSHKMIKQEFKKLSVIRNLESNYKCKHCSKVFKYYSKLRRHLKTHSIEKPCEKSLNHLISLKHHIITHSTEKPSLSGHKKSFQQLGNLKHHVQIRKKIFLCEYCKKTFTWQNSLRHHLQMHIGKQLFVCEYCKKSFALVGHLKRHILTHTGERPFICEQCKKSFTRMSCLKRHKLIHSGEKSFVCELCKKSFGQLHHLKRHILTHTGEKPFVCEHCKKTCSQLADLKRHIQTHTGEKPFLCEYCKKSFVRQGTLKLHLRRRHT